MPNVTEKCEFSTKPCGDIQKKIRLMETYQSCFPLTLKGGNLLLIEFVWKLLPIIIGEVVYNRHSHSKCSEKTFRYLCNFVE